MNGQKVRLSVFLVVGALLIALPLLSGCEKKSGTVDLPEPGEGASAAVEQTVCPVMGGAITNKDHFVEYKGKKVYFCCSPCKADFEKEPEKFIAKLPQFE